MPVTTQKINFTYELHMCICEENKNLMCITFGRYNMEYIPIVSSLFITKNILMSECIWQFMGYTHLNCIIEDVVM